MAKRRRRSYGAVTPRDLFVYEHDLRGNRYIPADGGRARLKRTTQWKPLSSAIEVIRTGGTADKAFQACVRVGGRGKPSKVKRASSFALACMFGRNPRLAIASALARASRQMKKRSGAFAGR